MESSKGAGLTTIGSKVLMLGQLSPALGGSEYLYQQTGEVKGQCPPFDIQSEKALQNLCLEANNRGLILAAHDISEGGIAVALAEMCLFNREDTIGIQASLGGAGRPSEILFSECQSVILIEVGSENAAKVQKLASEFGVPCKAIGTAGGDRFGIEPWIDLAAAELIDTYHNSLDRKMRQW